MWNGWTGIGFLGTMQDLRTSLPDCFTSFFETVSSSIVYLAVPLVIAALMFWYGDRRKGEFLFMSAFFGIVSVNALKFLIAQPRPWVLDPELGASMGALRHAGGYSLPSLHSAVSTSCYGSLAVLARRKIWVSALCCVLIVLIVFARLFLCVHTPVDVISGVLLGIAAIILSWELIGLSYTSDKAYYTIGSVYLAAAAALCIFIEINIDQNYANTRLGEGFILGFAAGRVIEHRFLRCTPPELSIGKKAGYAVLGLSVLGLLALVPWKFAGSSAAVPVFGFIGMIWVSVVYPYLLSRVPN